jgi:hypothetical protein
LRGSAPGAAKLERGLVPPRADPKVLPPKGLPLLPVDNPAKGDAPPELPKVSLGGAAGCAVVDEGGEANELSEGLPAASDPNALPL